MAEFCLECWNRLNGTQLAARDVVLTPAEEEEVCAYCRGRRRVIVRLRLRGPLDWLRRAWWALRSVLRR